MKPPSNKEIYYTYYSYENDKGIDGFGYIGQRKLQNADSPEKEEYYGTPKSPKNEFFKSKENKSKIILGIFETQEEAIAHEIYLHNLWGVDTNEHFANMSKQTSVGFSFSAEGEENPGYKYWKGKKRKKESVEKQKETLKSLNLVPYKRTQETINKVSEAKKGRIPWNKGRKWTDEERKNIGEGQKGRKRRFNFKNSTSSKEHKGITKAELMRREPDTLEYEARKLIRNEIEITSNGWFLE